MEFTLSLFGRDEDLAELGSQVFELELAATSLSIIRSRGEWARLLAPTTPLCSEDHFPEVSAHLRRLWCVMAEIRIAREFLRERATQVTNSTQRSEYQALQAQLGLDGLAIRSSTILSWLERFAKRNPRFGINAQLFWG
jgi:hypothetical protein